MNFRRLLRLGGRAKRKEHGAESKADDFFSCVSLCPDPLVTRHLTLTPSHLISLFARTSTSGGIVTPICFAVFRLITSSNFIGR